MPSNYIIDFYRWGETMAAKTTLLDTALDERWDQIQERPAFAGRFAVLLPYS